MRYDTLALSVDDRVLTITLNRPDKLNAFNLPMMNELIAAFDEADAPSPSTIAPLHRHGRRLRRRARPTRCIGAPHVS